jgi:Protein of unknown function (DUF551).
MNNWIKYKEQEPPKDTQLIFCDETDEEKDVCIGEYDEPRLNTDDTGVFYINDFGYKDATHWMPLPKHVNEEA